MASSFGTTAPTRWLTAVVLFLLQPVPTAPFAAGDLPSISIHVTAPPRPLLLQLPPAPPGGGDLGGYTEIPPAVWRLPASSAASAGCPPNASWPTGSVAVTYTTAWTILCPLAGGGGLPVNGSGGGPALAPLASDCVRLTSGESQAGWPNSSVPAGTDHRRNYQGVFAVAPLAPAAAAAAADAGGTTTTTTTTTSTTLFLAVHGENKNELSGTELYQNTVNSDVPAAQCYSGPHQRAPTSGGIRSSQGDGESDYEDCWPAYNGFVSGVLLPAGPASCFGVGAAANVSSVDVGPVAWPDAGYLVRDDGGGGRGDGGSRDGGSGGGGGGSVGGTTMKKASYGVRHPSVLGADVSHDGGLYLTWLSNGLASSEFWVARSAPGPAQGTSGSFMAWNDTSGAWDAPVLPRGFDPANAAASFAERMPAAVPGGGGRPLSSLAGDGSSDGIHFSIARVAQPPGAPPLYLGVGSFQNWTMCNRRRSGGSGGGGSGGGGGGIESESSSTPRSSKRSDDDGGGGGGGSSDASEKEDEASPRQTEQMQQPQLKGRWRKRGMLSGGIGPSPASASGCATPTWRLGLWVSRDLAHWDGPTVLPAYDAPGGWSAAPLQYPSLLSADGGGQGTVDAEGGFFIMGACSGCAQVPAGHEGPVVQAAWVQLDVGGVRQ